MMRYQKGVCFYSASMLLTVLIIGVFATVAVSATLEEKARKEGKMTWYTPMPTRVAEPLKAAFEKKYGIRVNMFRSGGEKVLAKIEAEAMAGDIKADIVDYSNIAATLSHQKKGYLASVVPENAKFFADKFKDDKGYWYLCRHALVAMGYNTKTLSADKAPTSWAEFKDKNWKDQIVTASPEYAGMAVQMVKAWHEMFGWNFLKGVADNGIMVVQGFGNSQDIMISGERPVASVHSGRMSRGIKAGQPVAIVYPKEGAILISYPIAVVKGCDKPNAAELFLDFVMSREGQDIIVKKGGYYPSRNDVDPPAFLKALPEFKTYVPDWRWLMVEDNAIELKDRWKKTCGAGR
jgi:iron(III) transport system substrate-binding protein